MAVAEHVFQFEHRDLHWGNVLISKQPVCYRRMRRELSAQTAMVTNRIGGREISFCNEGIVVSIIDFTLSRLEVVCEL